MSMDNGIYILSTKDKQNRVIHTKAIECLFDDFSTDVPGRELNPVRIMEFFGEIPATKDYDKAIGIAYSMLRIKVRELGYVEYGIRKISINKTWKQVQKEARERISLERNYLKGKTETYYKQKLKDLDVVEKMCS